MKGRAGTYHAIFVTGIPGAGKTTVTKKIKNRRRSFRVIDGDEIVRQIPRTVRLSQTGLIWSRLLDAVEEALEQQSVLVDSALTATQVREAREQFGDAAAFVILRIDEETRARRQADRRRRGERLAYEWNPEWHSIPGGDELYDLVCDAVELSPQDCARTILEFEAGRWPDSATR